MLITEDTVDYEDILTEDGDVGRTLPRSGGGGALGTAWCNRPKGLCLRRKPSPAA